MIRHFLLLTLFFLGINANAEHSDTTLSKVTPEQSTGDEIKNVKKNSSAKAHYQSIIDEYKQYLSTVDKKTRDEVVHFRKEMIKIGQMKKDLYKSLSQNAQLLLEKEKATKRNLPINLKKKITIQN